jgi:hypothetical protein
MEKRPYFVAGDILVNGFAGAAAAYVASAFFEGWHALPAMALGMLLGGLVSSVVAVAFMPLFGALEVMLPAMLTGMLSGMAGSRVNQPALVGVAIGLAVVGWVYLLTFHEQRKRT